LPRLKDERGQLGPAEDLPTMLILVVLIMIFVGGVVHAYKTFEAKKSVMDKYNAGLNLLDTLKNNVLAYKPDEDTIKPGMVYIDTEDEKATIKINPKDPLLKTEAEINGKKHIFYAYSIEEPFSFSSFSRNIQEYWGRNYLYEVIIKDESGNEAHIYHAGWATSFSCEHNQKQGCLPYHEIYNNLVNEQLGLVTLELPIAIKYGLGENNPFPGEVRLGKIEVLIW